MKANDIRTVAKAIRNGKSDTDYSQLEKFLVDAFDYVNANKDKWTEKFNRSIEEALDEIQDRVEELAPAEAVVEVKPEEKATETIPAVEEAHAEDDSDFPVKRYGFKTVLRRKTSEGDKDPVLSTIRWFAVVYALDTYGTTKCVKGMLERRGYGITGSDDSLIVFNNGEEVAKVRSANGRVAAFDLV